MLATLARKTWDLYSAPARYFIKQTRQGMDVARQLSGEWRQIQLQADIYTEELLRKAEQNLGIDISGMSREERHEAARVALYKAESGLTQALSEALKALLLLSADDKPGLTSKHQPEVFEGDYERVD